MTLKAFGAEPRTSLRRAYVASFYCRTALIDGKPEAMWGASRTALSESAVVWAAFSTVATKYPLAIVRETRRELRKMADDFGIALFALIDENDDRALIFAKALKFVEVEKNMMGLTVLEFN